MITLRRPLIKVGLAAICVPIVIYITIGKACISTKRQSLREEGYQNAPFFEGTMIGPETSARANTTSINQTINYFNDLTPKQSAMSDEDSTLEFVCSVKTKIHEHLQFNGVQSFDDDWTFTKRVNCPNFTVDDRTTLPRREKVVLDCKSGKAMLTRTLSSSPFDFETVQWLNDTCLASYINQCCYDDNKRVPNVVHYVWYFNKTMTFLTFTSIVSVIKFVRPCLILFHGEYLPYGRYWNYVSSIFPNIIHVKRRCPETIFGQSLFYHEHSGDVMRLEALQRFGGIYLDTDSIVLKPVDVLRTYDVTLCMQKTLYLLNAFILSKPNASFLSLWMQGYQHDYQKDRYAYNSMRYNLKLARSHPDLVHIEHGSLCRPEEMVGKQLDEILVYDWSDIYAFHIFSRRIHFPIDEQLVRNINTTFASMLRHILLNTKELCFN